ncbi:GTP-binding protein [Candidatus Micrarchaeota archaeon]|nr:GTP-binding protein [Candidatus Micrarchaeota archaeon]
MGKEQFNFVIVGHVDHGKSTLIGRLLYDTNSLPEGKMDELKKTCEMMGKPLEFAYLLDHLQEEREQNITIDTTQIFFKTQKKEYVIIDAPGHKEFLKNMITGASLAESAILIVDAKEGVQEQTKRHSYILGLLGLKQVIVVINKMDLVEYKKEKFEEIKKEIVSFLSRLNIYPSFIIPISAMEGDNIANKSKNIGWYEGLTVLEALDTFKDTDIMEEKALRLPIQDVYKFDERRILAGRIESGKIKKNDEIILLPEYTETIVKSIEEFNRQRDVVEAGISIGITTTEPIFTERGSVICKKGENLPKIINTLQGNIFWMSKTPFKKGERIFLKLATQEVECILEKIITKMNSSSLESIGNDETQIENTEVAKIICKLDKPIVVEDFNITPELGRFVLIQNEDICAGGILTNIYGD